MSHLVKALIWKIITQKMRLCPHQEFNWKMTIELLRTFLVSKFELSALTVKIVARQQLHLLSPDGVIPQRLRPILNSTTQAL